MSDETLIRMLEEAAGRVPDTPAPVGGLIEEGHGRIHRRRTAAGWGAIAAMVLVAGGLGLRNLPSGGSDAATSSGTVSTSGSRANPDASPGGMAGGRVWTGGARSQSQAGRLPTVLAGSEGAIDGRLVWSGGPFGNRLKAHDGTIHIVGTRADGVQVDDLVATDRAGRWSYAVRGGGTFTITGTSPGYGSADGTRDACAAGAATHVRPGQTVRVTVTCALR